MNSIEDLDQYDNIKSYEDMDDDDRAFAIGSARYILDGVCMEKMAEISGLPLGVISAAFENIFVTKDFVRPPKRNKPPKRIK
jgi:hypothetical protein